MRLEFNILKVLLQHVAEEIFRFFGDMLQSSSIVFRPGIPRVNSAESGSQISQLSMSPDDVELCPDGAQ